MTQAAPVDSLLSRDEMDALLEELAAARREEAQRRQHFGGAGRGDPHAPLRRSLEEFAQSYAKRLSTSYQRRIDWILRDTAVVDARDVSEIAAPGELFWVFGSEAAPLAWITWSRTLVFAWLQVAFGAPEPRGLAPERPYTAIERSFLVQIAQEAVSELAGPLREHDFEAGNDGALVEGSDLLLQSGVSFVQVQFEVRGFGDFGHFRLVLPAGGVARRVGAPGRPQPTPLQSHRGAVFGAPVAIHAEIASTEISVEALATLRAGDVLRARQAADGSLVLKVGDAPKFRAIRGTLGERLAVQVTERIKE